MICAVSLGQEDGHEGETVRTQCASVLEPKLLPRFGKDEAQ